MEKHIKELMSYMPYKLKGMLTEDKRENFESEDYYDEEKFKYGAQWELCGYAPGDLNIPLGEGEFNGFLWRNGNTYVNFHRGIFPIMRPMSDLIKEIEINDRKFIPIVEIAKLCDSVGEVLRMNHKTAITGIEFRNGLGDIMRFCYRHTTNHFQLTFFDEYDELRNECVLNQMEMFEKLFEWGFDVYGKINAAEVINIHTLPECQPKK